MASQKRPVRRPFRRGGAVLAGLLWAAPLSLFGLLLALPVVLAGGRARVLRRPLPALLVAGALADRMLRRHPFGAMSGMALGHVVLVQRQALSPRLLRHELQHVRQAARWGLLFPLAYLAASAWALLRGRDAYWHNAFEVAARAAEKRG
ncbi:MAG TPA: signal peptide prediction [Burkholderiaceae bacterium]|nr:signal peptide prediction [Burkholderiaceae bacterium]